MSARRNIIPVFVPNLGCPNDCVFCNQRIISGKTKAATPETVISALESAEESNPEMAGAELAFYGGSFTAMPAEEQEALLSAAGPYLESGKVSSIRLSTRPDAVDEDTLRRLSGRGVETIELGAQSMRDEVLNSSGRGHISRDTIRASHMIKAAGFKLIIQLMTGLPGDDDDGAVFSARAAAALGPDGVRIYPTVIIRDTALHGMWLRGDYMEHTVEDAVRVCSELIPIFEKENIPVIRLGLNPSDELSGGAAVAGAYHPAFGELVYSRLMLQRARDILRGTRPGADIVIGVNPQERSAMIGQHRSNMDTLKKEFSISTLSVKGTDVPLRSVVLLEA